MGGIEVIDEITFVWFVVGVSAWLSVARIAGIMKHTIGSSLQSARRCLMLCMNRKGN